MPRHGAFVRLGHENPQIFHEYYKNVFRLKKDYSNVGFLF
jgi:hypothetical protein